jgi:glucose-6-phosphate dehydrogenase assembly protein OpcA
MATNYLTLGQVNPTSTTATTLYTVPSSTQAVVSTITICNSSSATATYRIAVRKGGEALSQKQYIAYDSTVLGNDTIGLTLGISLSQTDVLTVYASSGSVSFNAFGSEVTA